MKDIQEDLKSIFYIGLGVVNTTSEKILEVKDELLEKGKELYDKGVVFNDELKHNAKEQLKKVNEKVNGKPTSEELVDIVGNMNEEEKNKFIEELNKKGLIKNAGKGDCNK